MYLVVKRLIDIVISSLAILLLLPIFFVTFLLVRFNLGSPVIYKQTRPGLNEELFDMYKFRTMTDARDDKGNLLPDKERLTLFGKRLRSLSIDELPELFNILKGEMSIVGPRPLLVEYLDLYNENQKKRHQVRPGLTGYAQVNGRNNLSWEKKFMLDIYYVDNISFLMDLKIFLKTFQKVFMRDGINADGEETVEKFRGNQDE